eukprot:354725-Pelagomonas_calceolata.AAC.1
MGGAAEPRHTIAAGAVPRTAQARETPTLQPRRSPSHAATTKTLFSCGDVLCTMTSRAWRCPWVGTMPVLV